MEIIIKGTPKEIAELALELQDQQIITQQQDFKLAIDNNFLKNLNQKADITNLDEMASATLKAYREISNSHSK